jgi:hypothetical protein
MQRPSELASYLRIEECELDAGRAAVFFRACHVQRGNFEEAGAPLAAGCAGHALSIGMGHADDFGVASKDAHDDHEKESLSRRMRDLIRSATVEERRKPEGAKDSGANGERRRRTDQASEGTHELDEAS